MESLFHGIRIVLIAAAGFLSAVTLPAVVLGAAAFVEWLRGKRGA
jgi:hypothetical protein